MNMHCGRWVTYGHGDSVPCGKVDGQTGKTAQCEQCQIASLTATVEQLTTLARHMRGCMTCGEHDVTYCEDGENLWRAALGEP